VVILVVGEPELAVRRPFSMGGTAIGENAVVQDSIMGPGAVVGASAHVVGHSVLGTGAVLVDGEYLTGQCRLEVA
tara:strand:+ start:354 stop:578 length:225 start_codon:yes stop_codon:yes gene_type:complete